MADELQSGTQPVKIFARSEAEVPKHMIETFKKNNIVYEIVLISEEDNKRVKTQNKRWWTHYKEQMRHVKAAKVERADVEMGLFMGATSGAISSLVWFVISTQ